MTVFYIFRKKKHLMKTHEVRQLISFGSLIPILFFLGLTEFKEITLGPSTQKMNPQFKSQDVLWEMQSLV